jgi:pimeloyl-ACP methyl ester carboxylesterase
VLASGDRRPELAHTPVPTLVIHGSRDPMFPLAAGRALAELVPHGTWLPIQGMAHYMPSAMWPVIVRAIARHAQMAR